MRDRSGMLKCIKELILAAYYITYGMYESNMLIFLATHSHWPPRITSMMTYRPPVMTSRSTYIRLTPKVLDPIAMLSPGVLSRIGSFWGCVHQLEAAICGGAEPLIYSGECRVQ